MARNFERERVVVTGANRGIGQAIATALAAAGMRVAVAGRDASACQAVVDDLPGEHLALPLDLSNEASIDAAIAQVESHWGGVDHLVNNGGIGSFGPTDSFPLDDFDRILATNVRGAFRCCQGVLPGMCAQGFGRIINVGSVVSVKGYPLQAAYTASKHALLGMTKSLAAEYQDRGVRVSAVLPGGVDTDMARDARPDLDPDTLMSAEDVAEAVSYLLALSPRVCVDCIQLRRAGAAPF